MKNKSKADVIKYLKTLPIVEVACKKAGISRNTFYRWRKEDEKFRLRSDRATKIGVHFVNDIAESQLYSAIKDKNMTAIIFWLKSHDKTYANKVEVSGQLKHDYKLTIEEESLVTKALTAITQKGGDK